MSDAFAVIAANAYNFTDTWRPTLSKIKINTVARLYYTLYLFVPIIISFVLQTVKQKIKNGQRTTLKFLRNRHIGELPILKDIEMRPTRHSKKSHLYSFVPFLLSFIHQKVRRYSDFKISERHQEGKLAILKDIEM